MKKLILILLIASCNFVYGQGSLPVEFGYDAAGNRVMRRVIELRMGHSRERTSDTSHCSVQLGSARINVYPNPTDGVVTMELPADYPSVYCKATVYDNNGRLLFERSAVAGNIIIDLTGYTPGNYIIDLAVNDEHSFWKVIKK